MLRALLAAHVQDVLATLIRDGTLSEAARAVPVEVQDTKQPEHGDFALNWALVGSKGLGRSPRELGALLADRLPGGPVASAEVAGPGFVNLRLHPVAVAALVRPALAHGERLLHSKAERPLRINLEYVSVNPNGPITVGSGRGAAFGSALANVLKAAGHTVHQEYYINDGVNSEQMRLFAESVRSYVEGIEFPERGYRGEYVQDVARALGAPVGNYQQASQEIMLARQREDLAAFGVVFDTWFSEQSLHDTGTVAARIEELQRKGVADERPVRTKLKLGRGGTIQEVVPEPQTDQTPEDEDEGDAPAASSQPPTARTLWLRSTRFGDDMDRVLRRRDGRLTYIASDVAYHADKFRRPEDADKLVTVLGPDHHGYIGRLTAVMAALFSDRAAPLPDDRPLTDPERELYGTVEARNGALGAVRDARDHLQVVIYQLVRFLREGRPAPMRKRDGNIYELRDLMRELASDVDPTGRDAARFFFLTRSHDTALDFDLDLATSQTDENPVFYVQYAHARICSVLRRAEEVGHARTEQFDPSLLTDARELALIKKVLDGPWEVARVAQDYGVHRLTTYAVELARTYHHFYDACRVVQPDQPGLTQARLNLCELSRQALAQTLGLLGVSAPERMEREKAEAPAEVA